jgi:hypothetical protein
VSIGEASITIFLCVHLFRIDLKTLGCGWADRDVDVCSRNVTIEILVHDMCPGALLPDMNGF